MAKKKPVGRRGFLKGAAAGAAALVAKSTTETAQAAPAPQAAAPAGLITVELRIAPDYKTVAERVMNEDQIPPGYRFYVQRYFQLIRPRD